ncbi:MAG: molybdopterin molybdotransferase MoeA [Planctomycetota bacterium]|jgi:molybdopterin molybdotransferase
MIPFEQALGIVLDSARVIGTERVELADSLDRVLAEDVVSDVDSPPFNKSAMDGYAARRCDLANELSIIETIPAGCAPEKRVGENQCAKIMTGAPVPEGSDCVIMIEHTERTGDNTIRFTLSDTRDNICPRGEDIRKGDTVLNKGELIAPAHIAVMASAGCARPLVSQQVRVGIIATGDEIVEPAEKPSRSQIRNSNGPQLLAQVRRMGAAAHYHGIARDCEESTDRIITEATSKNDVLLISGGVSVGEFDLVPEALRRGGFELLFEKVAIKPGMPTVFGKSDRAFCFGLPGNPVSTFVLFEILIKPFLFRMMGHEFTPPNVIAPLGKTITRKKTDRMSWIPVVLTDSGSALPVEYHGSAHVLSLCSADGLISMPVGTGRLEEGTHVSVRQI